MLYFTNIWAKLYNDQNNSEKLETTSCICSFNMY